MDEITEETDMGNERENPNFTPNITSVISSSLRASVVAFAFL
jgi:hypothetical protein